MTCGLNDGELFILNVLRVGRNLTDKSSYNLKQIAAQCRTKYGQDPNEIAEGLTPEYLTAKRKKDIKYWISNKSKTWYALSQHGYNVGDINERRIIRRTVFRL